MADLIALSLLEKLGRELISVSKKSEKTIRDELDLLNHSIEEVDMKKKFTKVWAKRMRKVSELIEDVVDEYYTFPTGSFALVNYLGRAGGSIGSRRDLASNIKNIKAELLDINEGRGAAHIERYQNRPQFVHPSKEEFLEGISPLVGVLMRNYLVGGEPPHSAVAVIGMAGIGKATFAKVYDDEVVREHFDCRAWIVQPQSPNVCEVVKSVAKQICVEEAEDVDGMSFAEVVRTVRRFLESKRYLLVFDDVSGIEIWYVMKEALPDDDNGSRIIITTRSERIASAYKVHSLTHKVNPLSDKKAHELLLSIVFRHDLESHFASELLHLSNVIIRMCQDLPLAIIAVAGLLLTKGKFPQEWRKLIENFSFEVEPNAQLGCLIEILALGFFDLPHKLKSCFMYFSIFFLRESLVPNDKLFKLWIAEGFVQEKTGKTLEEVAQEYLDELIARNLVQAREGFYGIEKFSRVHCLMREILQKEAVERSFCQIWGVDEDSSFTGKSRRLLISNHDVENVLETIEECQVRSVFLSNVGALNNSVLVRLFEKYKLLTLLNVENSPLDFLPEEVGNLLCLKYLSLKNTKVRKLPKSIGKLRKLQTLDLTRTLLVELPMEIFKLQNLRHLLASRCDNEISLNSAKGVRIKAGIGYLVNLQTLMTVEAHLSSMDVVQELKRLSQLRSLSVSRLTTELASALCACIEVMSHLESLCLHCMNHQSLDLQTISSPPPHMERLVLKGLLQTFPIWISSLQNLIMLCLSLSSLSDDPLQHLCHLPKLESLWLYKAYEGEKLRFPEGGFKKLKLLVLRHLQELEAVEIEEGALPLLEELRIGPSPLLNELPSGVKRLTNLKVVSFYDMPKEFVLRMRPDVGLDYCKVKHVPSVFIWYRDEGRRYISYQLGNADLWDRLEDLNTNINDFSQRDFRLSFCYSDDEEDSASTSVVQWNDMPQLSFSSDRFSFFTDDVEE